MTNHASHIPFATYPETLAFLEQLDWGVMEMGIERMAAVLNTLGNPQDRFKAIHVVGTNGKGSTCAALNSIYTAQGYQVGLFTSPHLVDVRERLQLNGQLVSEDDFVASAASVQAAIRKTFPDGKQGLTYFEFLNAMAFHLFSEKEVDIALIEAGLGGRLDSTNTLSRPLLIIVTPISLDHTDRLGDTLEKIASEKAGVFKPGCPVLSAPQTPEVSETLNRHALETGAILQEIDTPALQALNILEESGSYYRMLSHKTQSQHLKSNLLGRYQTTNLSIALQAIDMLHPLLPVEAAALEAGLKAIHWPGRFQHIPGTNLIIDGSHNEQGIQSLLTTLKEDFPNQDIHWGVTLLANRSRKLLQPLADYPKTVSLTALYPHEPNRFHPPENLPGSTPPETLDAFLTRPSKAGELRILTGSLYTVGAALSALEKATV